MEISRFAIVGLGSIGRRHLRILKEMRPEIEVTLIRSGSGQNWPEEKLAKNTVHSIDEAVGEGIQAAIISSPAPLHLLQAVELANAGVHLLIEKPLSHTIEGINKFLNKLLTKGITVLIGYVLRYDPCARKFKEILESGSIGQFLHANVECGSYLPDWRHEQDYRKTVSALPELGGGVLLELSHELDYIQWFFGEIKSVQANLYNSGFLGIEVEESADLIMTNEDGMPVSVQLDFNRRQSTRRCTVHGTKGELTWNAITKQVICHLAGGEPEVESFDFEHDHIYLKQLQHFLDCIENEASPLVTLQDGLAVLRLVEAAREANKTGQRVALV
jgi:predicted dehydrogenase